MKIDLAIIGGGPAGYVAAERAGEQGLNVVLFEKKELGGVCLNEGCIPTKTLLYSAKLYDYAQNGKKYGITAENVACDFGRMMDRKTKVVRKLNAGVALKMKAAGVQVINGEAMIGNRTPEGILLSCDGESFLCTHLLICTGSQSFIPPIPGLRDGGEFVVTHRELLQLRERPASLVVIGGGVIGMEFAGLFRSLGTQVTVIEMLPEILGGSDTEVSAMLREIYAKKGIQFNLSCKVTRVDGSKVIYIDAGGNEQSVNGEKILVSVGRRPVIDGFGIEKLGIKCERGGICTDGYMQTNVPCVYAAGDVTGFSLLAHTAEREGEVAVDHIMGGSEVMRYDAIPGIVYTHPEVAGVGMTEEVAAAHGIAYRVLKLPMAYAGRFVAENEGGTGVCKILVSESDRRIIGAHLLGGPCSEMIWGIGLAIEKQLTVEEMRRTIFPHPTVSEIIKETLFSK